uniref:DUF2975 domain-containing protein n=1 Tax=Flavobacterium sp. TaxID=239 RepID=UPI00404A986C
MEIKITTNQILKVLHVLSWIIFLGLCIEAGGIAFNTFMTFVVNPLGAQNFWQGADLSDLYNFDAGHFLVITSIMTIVAVLKAIMFYMIVKLFMAKKFNMSQPFSSDLRRFILNLSYLALGTGLFSYYGIGYMSWLKKQGLSGIELETLHLAGADIWFFMVVILFVIAQIVKRGIEIQNENDLTI